MHKVKWFIKIDSSYKTTGFPWHHRSGDGVASVSLFLPNSFLLCLSFSLGVPFPLFLHLTFLSLSASHSPNKWIGALLYSPRSLRLKSLSCLECNFQICSCSCLISRCVCVALRCTCYINMQKWFHQQHFFFFYFFFVALPWKTRHSSTHNDQWKIFNTVLFKIISNKQNIEFDLILSWKWTATQIHPLDIGDFASHELEPANHFSLWKVLLSEFFDSFYIIFFFEKFRCYIEPMLFGFYL